MEQLLPYHVFQIHDDDLLTEDKRTPQQDALGECRSWTAMVDRQSSSSQRILSIASLAFALALPIFDDGRDT